MGRQATMENGISLGVRLPRGQVDQIDAQLRLRPELIGNRSAVIREAVQFYFDDLARWRLEQKPATKEL